MPAAVPTPAPAAEPQTATHETVYPLYLHEPAVIPAQGAVTVAVRYPRLLDTRALEDKEDIFIEALDIRNRNGNLIQVTFPCYVKSPNQGLQPYHYLTLRNQSAVTISLPIGHLIGRACAVRIPDPLPERKVEQTLVNLVRRVVSRRTVKATQRRLRRFKKEEEKEKAINKFTRDRRLPTYTRAE